MSSLVAQLAFKAAVGSKPRRRRLRRPPRIAYPSLVEREYLAGILKLIEPARRLVEQHLMVELSSIVRSAGARVDGAERTDDDDYSARLARVMNGITVEYGRQVPEQNVESTATGAATSGSRFNKAQVNRQIKTVLGIDVFQTETWLAPAAKAFTRENVKLIKSIPGRYFDEIEALVSRGARAGRRVEDIAMDVEHRYGVSKSRAATIARDQVGKWNGHLTRRRHEDLGLHRYRWRTSMDERVRGRPDGKFPDAKPSHWDREGKIFSYDKPPPGGNPGEAVLCRCGSEPVFEDILGEGGAMDLTPSPAASRAAVSWLHAERRTKRGSDHEVAIRAGMSLGEAENTIRNKRFEHIGVFAGDGRLLHTDVGGQSSVPVPESVLTAMRKRRDVTVTHNHPRGSPLSPADVALAITGNARELRATVPSGGAWVIRKPAEGWRTRLAYGKLLGGLSEAYTRAEGRTIERVKEAIDRGSKEQPSKLVARFLGDEVPRSYREWAESRGYRWSIHLEHR